MNTAGTKIKILKEQLDFHGGRELHPLWHDDILPSLEKEGRWQGDGLPNEDYHALPGVSSSFVRDYMDDPYNIEYAHNNPKSRVETPDMKLGTLIHAVILEGKEVETDEDMVEGLRAAGAKNPRAKVEYKEWKAALEDAGTTLVKPEEKEMIERFNSMCNGPVGGNDSRHYIPEMLQKADIRERSHFLVHPVYNLILKCRPDAYNPEEGLIVDVKTGQRQGWSKDVTGWGYDIQAAHYCGVMDMLARPMHKMLFLKLTKFPPYKVGGKMIDPENAALAARAWDTMIEKIRHSFLTGDWGLPYDPDIETNLMPEWRKDQLARLAMKEGRE